MAWTSPRWPGVSFFRGYHGGVGGVRLAIVRPDAVKHCPALGRVGQRVAILVVLGMLIGLVPNFYFTSFRILGCCSDWG
ncbi:hypothetical protein K3G63_17195 [Hymenobacter sp. HSC-4F20]|uniref:hypothetical protein n=1 Tax=Hymenobacter sp. HSC-4F20 TaxID=2864135 RepID=UPI001C72D1F8|nr:hypothetical protein [Hymenobacter sp. HSC-4F20]MBX0292188.1 hypothetical protein [Hymenobacter sp. HSC-4F20]